MTKVDIYKYLLKLAIADMYARNPSADTMYEITSEIVGQIESTKFSDDFAEKLKAERAARAAAQSPDADSVKGAEVSE